MKTKTKWLAALALGLTAMTAGRAEAANPSYLNIDVTITANVSVAVNTVASSTQSFTWSGAATQVSATSATVTNDSAFFASQWKLSSTPSSWDGTTWAAGWAIAGSAGADQLKLQAVLGPSGFSGSCNSGSFGNSTVAPALSNTTPITYTAAVLGDTTGLGAGASPDNTSTNKMNAGSSRALCWQMTMPTSTSLSGTQVVPIVVTAF
jgi:hypothetical protein